MACKDNSSFIDWWISVVLLLSFKTGLDNLKFDC